MKVYNRRRSDLAMEDVVKAYYGKELKSSADLKTSACCDANAISNSLKTAASKGSSRGLQAILRLRACMSGVNRGF